MSRRRAARVGPAAWLGLALGLGLYAGVLLALPALGFAVDVMLPSWAPLGAPPLVYVLLGLLGVRPRSFPRALVAAAAMCAFHALLVAATAALYSAADLVAYGAAVVAALWGSPTVTLLQLVAVPLTLAPLRPLFVARSRDLHHGAARPAPQPPRAAAVPEAAPRLAAPAIAPAPPAPPPPAATVASPPPVTPTRARPVAVVESSTAPSARAEPEPRAAAAPAPAARETADARDDMISIPFGRVVDQLPVEMFLLSRERTGAHLRAEAGHVLVPRRLVLPQLGEGLVRVKWEVVADQFPRKEIALPDADIASRLPDGSLVLPLDEVVRQVPPELLALASPPADVHGIEDFPPPFQPHVPPPAATAEDRRPPAPPPPPPARTADERPSPARGAREDPVEEVLALLESAAPAPVPPPTPPLERERVTPAPADGGGPTREARRLGTLLASLMNSLEVGARDGTGTTVFTVIAPALSEDAVVRTAMRILPFLADARLPAPASQATLRGADATIVLTPLGAPGAGGPLLAAGVASGASLAMLERLSLRAAGEARVAAEGGARAGRHGPASGGPEVRVTLVPPSVRAVADSLTAFGPVAPTVLRDAPGSLLACLFLPRSVDAPLVARFAWDLHRALEGSEIGAVSSVMLRLGTHCVVVRMLEAGSGCATVLVGGGPVDRPGLARIELNRAATRLGAVLRG